MGNKKIFIISLISLFFSLVSFSSETLDIPGLKSKKKPFISMYDYFSSNSQYYDEIMQALNKAFYLRCLDVFCEGDYPNWKPLVFECSIETATGNMHECYWLFAGYGFQVNEEKGKVKITSKTLKCPLDFTGLNVNDVFNQIKSSMDSGVMITKIIDIVFPNKKLSIYKQLVSCFP
jgi:hypothetical protein